MVVDSGATGLSLLSATPDPSYVGVYQTYIFGPAGLTLGGKPVRAGMLGFGFAAAKNPCLKEKAIFLNAVDLRRIRSLKDRNGRLEYLTKLVRQQFDESPLKKLYPLRIHNESIVAIDEKGAVLISPISMGGNLPFQLCSVEDIPLS
jgi:hypothetical protein